MFKGRERRFSSAHAIAIAALFFALGGAFPGIGGQIASGNLSLAGAASLPSGSTIALACKANSGSLAVNDARVWATRVGSLHGLPVPID